MMRPLLPTALLLTALFCLPTAASAQVLPSVTLQDLDGNSVNAETLHNDGKPMVVSFWATWCKPCLQELVSISEVYDEWREDTGVRLVAITIDDVRNRQMIAPFVRGKGWEFDVYRDENSELKRALNVNNIPHTLLYDGKGKLVYQHTSYVPGDEETLYEKLLELSK